ncbi:hypothetical protein B0T24DRAFT_379653 [Lasiosphaeria ovina]|uniref:Uncharacterized protein n=1 Tax=Lasiosphaeria ovina TaxID=92902 RepID=A0AAE0N170_9PEZI|nr:hypothetical protein B0T24DRAFT_379653 [Lasiosphaeria ovina]
MVALSFRDLARELRDMVYEYYVAIDGGYIFNLESGKLKAASPRAHLFALQQTCKRVADELTGLALTHNLVTFSTIPCMRDRAFLVEFLFNLYFRFQVHAVIQHFDEKPASNSLREAVARHYPSFLPCLNASPDDWAPEDPDINVVRDVCDGNIGVARSSCHEFADFVLHHLEPDNATYPDAVRLRLSDKYWDIPSDEELDKMVKALRPTVAELEADHGPIIEFDGLWEENRFLYRFSAAAAAIRFLRSNPSSRVHIRRILLDEDREAVAYPETHGKGLVPFCTENPHIRIERRVSLWKNMFSSICHSMRPSMWRSYGAEHHQKHRFEDSYLNDWYSRIGHCSVSNSVAKWALEALGLPGSISVVLDCDSTPERCSQMLEEAVVQDAVWQKAQEECFARQLLPPPPIWEWRSIHSTNAFICQDFPKIVQDIVNGTSVISCNFPINGFSDIDVEQLIWDHRGMSRRLLRGGRLEHTRTIPSRTSFVKQTKIVRFSGS